MLGTTVKRRGEMITIKRGLYKTLTAHKDVFKGAYIDRRFMGGFCVTINYAGKLYRFKHATEMGAKSTLRKLLDLTK